MHATRIILTAIVIMALGLQSGSFARDTVQLISEENGRLLVDIGFDSLSLTHTRIPPFLSAPGEPPLHYARFYVAVSDGADVRAHVLDGSYKDEKGGLPRPELEAAGARDTLTDKAGFYPKRPCIVSEPFVFRKTLVVAVDCYSEQVDYAADTKRKWSHYSVEVQFTPNPPREKGSPGDPILSRLVINRSSLPPVHTKSRLPTEGRRQVIPEPHFSRSPNWVRIQVSERGIYKITGAELSSIVELSSIDPATFRLFTGGGVAQSRALGDSAGTWLPDQWMQECALLVSNLSGPGTFGARDSLVFYGLGSKGWLDLYEAGADEHAFNDHPYETYNVYFLTWGGSFEGSPLRMESIPADTVPAPYHRTHKERLHFEKDLIKVFDYGDDGWIWRDISRKTGPEVFPPGGGFQFQVDDLVTSLPQEFRTVATAPYCELLYCTRPSENPWNMNLNHNHHAVYRMNDSTITEHIWSIRFSYSAHYTDADLVTASGAFLREGTNSFALSVPRDSNPEDFMYLCWFDVSYYRSLNASGDVLAFSTPDTTGTVNFMLGEFSTSGTPVIFDVTDQYRPKILSGFRVTSSQGKRDIRFSTSLSGTRKHFWACSGNTFQRPASLGRCNPRDLRYVTSSPHMLIVCNGLFEGAAGILRAHRQSHFPYFSNPDVRVVRTQDVFDSFSGGLKDPMAIRNYCKFLYDNFTDGGGSPLLTFLILLGDPNTDYKNLGSSQPDHVPTNLNLEKKASDEGAYATDDWFTLMDVTDDDRALALPDIAVGRLPASSVSEAFLLVNKIVQYETESDFAPWRGKVVLVADDEIGTQSKNEWRFTSQSESIARDILPRFVDVHKIYLTEFPAILRIKPESRLFFLKKWNSGVLLINFIGHGSSQQMADEQVFLGSDVGNLTNGLRLPLFLAMSCTIGDFDNPLAKSLAEKLILRENGGAIGAITASQRTLITPNGILDYNYFAALFPDTPSATEPIGVALMVSKVNTVAGGSQYLVENNEKYNLLGDPALQLIFPENEIRLANDDADTLIAGVRKRIEGSVYTGSAVDTTFSGTAHLLVREPDDPSGYRTELGTLISYHYARGVIYRGTADVERGRFSFDFRVPRFPSTGPYVYITAYAEDGRQDAITTKRHLEDFALISPSDSNVAVPIDGPPRVELGFRGGTEVVKPGATLQAIVRDADGINILSTTNEGKQALLFDDSNLPLDVTEFFVFDHGGVDTSGALYYPLSDISVGKHRAMFKVGDSFGQTSTDTLFFTVTDPLDYFAEAVFNYPNPFSESTHFLFRLSDPGRIHLSVFTVSGRRIRRLEKIGEGGEVWVFWDGRDRVGDRVANGTYLYVARIEFFGVDRPPVVLRGTLVKME